MMWGKCVSHVASWVLLLLSMTQLKQLLAACLEKQVWVEKEN